MATPSVDQELSELVDRMNADHDRMAAALAAVEAENAALRAEMKSPGALVKAETVAKLKAAGSAMSTNADKAASMAEGLPAPETKPTTSAADQRAADKAAADKVAADKAASDKAAADRTASEQRAAQAAAAQRAAAQPQMNQPTV